MCVYIYKIHVCSKDLCVRVFKSVFVKYRVVKACRPSILLSDLQFTAVADPHASRATESSL